MKDSGVEWIGEITEEWRSIKLKYLVELSSTKGQFRGTNYIGLENIESWTGRIIASEVTTVDSVITDFDDCSVLFGKLRPYLAKVARPQEKGQCSTEILVFNPNGKIDKNYLFWSLLNPEFITVVDSSTYGTKMPRANWEFVGNTYLPVPPLAVQHRIATYLDRKCSSIDSLITKQQASIEKLKAYKQSVITEAVTKGLDPDAPMKDSGVEWIGEIPEGWEIYKLKFLFDYGKGLNITKENLVPTGIPIISYGQIHSKINNGTEVSGDLIRHVPESFIKTNPFSLVKEGDFLVADTSEDIEGCGNMVYIDTNIQLFGGYHTIILKSKGKAKKYLAYLFKTDCWRSQIRKRVSGIKVFSISKRILNETTVILPDITEQQAISTYLDRKCSSIDSLISKKQSAIESLKAYKKSLIYEVVTGKREV